jgi:hypothetical protein
MQVQHPFRTVTPTVDGDVLVVLAGADAAFTPPQVHRLVGGRSEAGVRKALNRLAEQGVVGAERVGQAVTYRLNRRHLAAEHIVGIARLYQELIDRVRRSVAAWDRQPEYVALFGSLARREMRPDSDIDVLVVRPDRVVGDDPVWRDQLDGMAEDITAWTGNDARVLELSAGQARIALAEGQQVVEDVRGHGVVVHGPSDYLARRLGSAATPA